MSYSPNEWKAIGWWATKNNLVPQLSARPTVRFKSRDTGIESSRQIFGLKTEYEAMIKQERKGNAKAKKQQEAADNATRNRKIT